MLVSGRSSAQNAAPSSSKTFPKVQWASEVMDKSSQDDDHVHAARWVLGWPNAVPQGGFSGAAWQPKKDGNDEHIKVSFARPMPVSRVVIVENINPGSVSRVLAPVWRTSSSPD